MPDCTVDVHRNGNLHAHAGIGPATMPMHIDLDATPIHEALRLGQHRDQESRGQRRTGRARARPKRRELLALRGKCPGTAVSTRSASGWRAAAGADTRRADTAVLVVCTSVWIDVGNGHRSPESECFAPASRNECSSVRVGLVLLGRMLAGLQDSRPRPSAARGCSRHWTRSRSRCIDDYRAAAAIFRSCSSRGAVGRAIVDCLIASRCATATRCSRATATFDAHRARTDCARRSPEQALLESAPFAPSPPHDRPHPLRPEPHRHAAHRRRAHGAVLLALRAPPRRHVHPAHRGHRPRALHARGGAGDPRRHAVARPRPRRGPVLPDAAHGPVPRGHRPVPARRQGLPLLLLQGRTRRDARRADGAQGKAALRRPLPPPHGAGRRRQPGGALPQSGRGPGGRRRRRARPDHVRQRRARRPDHRALRRHAHLQLLRGGRRLRHAGHARDPRRRPHQQHAAADQACCARSASSRRCTRTCR